MTNRENYYKEKRRQWEPCRRSEGMKYIITIALLALVGLTANAGELEDWLIDAAEVGNLAGVNQLLARGAYVDAKNDDGNTPLIIATWRGHTEIVRDLIAGGADVNALEHIYGGPPLIIAAWRGNTGIVQALIKAGANVDGRDNMYGLTPLITAAQHGHTDIVQALIKALANVNARDKDGFTALMKATRRGHTEIIALLKEAGATE